MPAQDELKSPQDWVPSWILGLLSGYSPSVSYLPIDENIALAKETLDKSDGPIDLWLNLSKVFDVRVPYPPPPSVIAVWSMWHHQEAG